MTPRVDLRDVGKQFAGVWVLRGVTLAVPPGAVLGLVGENGAGKSTLMNVLAGVHRPDSGAIQVDGAEYAPRSPAEAAGVALVHQELNLFPNLSVAENLFLDRLPTRGAGPFRRLDLRTLRADAEQALAAVGLAVDPGRPVSGLSPGERQLVEVAKGLAAGARVLILDEPTTSLTRPEADRLFALVRQVRAEGKSVVYISHNLPDVLALCDAVAVLRDGGLVAHGPAGEFTEGRLITLMVGRQLEQVYPRRATAPAAEPLLVVDRLTRPGLPPVSLTVHRGEVLGIAGLMGAGRTELARAVFGLDPVAGGAVRLGGGSLARLSPAARIAKGLAFLTEDRRGDGLLMDATLTDEVSLAALPRHGPWLGPGRLRQAVAAAAIRVNLSQGRLDERTARTLSGGNQQKAVLAKWLLAGPKVLILDEPTRGVDVGARAEIYRTINGQVEAGAGVLMISSEVEELIGMCDRILVLAGGAVRAEFRGPDFDREAILRAALAGRAA